MSDQPLTQPPQETIVGFYGKMPSRGDFVRRGLPDSFVDPWDTWLQGLLAQTQAEIGNDWLDAYLNAPIWYFVVSSGVLDEHLWAGAMMPSVDRVGRYFPLVQAIGIADGIGLIAMREALGDWFQTARDSLLDALERDELDIDQYFETLSTEDKLQFSRPLTSDMPLQTHGSAPAIEIAGRPEAIFGAAGFDAVLSQSFTKPCLFWKENDPGQVMALLLDDLESFKDYYLRAT